MFEIFSQEDIQEMIDVNKLIVSYDNELHGVDMETLDEIFKFVNSFNGIIDRRKRIIKKVMELQQNPSYTVS